MIATSEAGLSVLDAVAMYKELSEVESGFRQLEDVMADATYILSDRDANNRAYICGGVWRYWYNAFWADGSKRLGWICRRRGPCKHRADGSAGQVPAGKGQPERRGVAGGSLDCADAVLKVSRSFSTQRPPVPPEGEATVM